MQSQLNTPVLEQLIDSLQSSYSVEEACKTIEPLVQHLFPDEIGAIFVMNSSKNLLEAIATWGSVPLTSDSVFSPHECLALRRGQANLVDDTQYCLNCQHIRANSPAVETFCVPMIAHGDTVGLLSVSSLQRGRIAQTRQSAEKVAKHIGLALANLKLRETLKTQTFRDPLTKLYNRRYLEECFEREIRKSQRQPKPIGVILLEIDEMEQLNQRFGKSVADLLLREIGFLLPSQVRASDIACRYGGQQFLLLLPEAALAVTQRRAEQLRQRIEQLSLDYRGQSLGSLTISAGIASFAEHGKTAKEVLQAAQIALNSAIAGGRDRIVIAS
ncbi:GGDEF domain-containing protein [Coleofasciculus sp. E2-BRE-01]|jgi:diguanylate cyclase (GGDEF)-like protein|uniref:GGDEF domain-containing protein n=1 Tax=Coleofasciculus sp. E2-BRE-01 TaxID=3069524 RepID=UPI003302B72E